MQLSFPSSHILGLKNTGAQSKLRSLNKVLTGDKDITVYRVELLEDLYSIYYLEEFTILDAAKRLRIPKTNILRLFNDLILSYSILPSQLEANKFKVNPDFKKDYYQYFDQQTDT